MRTAFDESVKRIQEELIKMASLTEKQIYNSVESLTNKDINLAREVIEKDNLLDKMQIDIEDAVIKLIAMQNPLASDLREVFSMTKVASELERIADYGVNIAKITTKVLDVEYTYAIEEAKEMVIYVCQMIKESIDAYITKNQEETYRVCAKDDKIDSIYKKIVKGSFRILKDEMEVNDNLVNLLFVCKFLERAGDHVTNICEQTVYLITGEYKELND